MAAKPRSGLITRRTALAGLAGLACYPGVGASRATAADAGPVFSKTGPNAELYGAAENSWLLPGNRRQFALFGDWGQRICVDPASKLILVQTGLEPIDEVWRLWSAVVEQFG
jgi:hypothetical protein